MMMSVLNVLLSCVLTCSLAKQTHRGTLYQHIDEGEYRLKEDRRWPHKNLHLGQVSGIDARHEPRVYVFHRGSLTNAMAEFYENNTWVHTENGPLKEKTIVIIDTRTGSLISAMGEDRFYRPHGLTVDGQGNIWVTDMASHQVMRFPRGSKEPDMVLGEKLVPGSDDTHFCKPTNVAVASNGDFFVTDGYCNNRVMKFNKNGTVAKIWGEGNLSDEPGPMTLDAPHSATLVEKYDMVCVADRRNSRVQCYNAGLQDANKAGEFLHTLLPDTGEEVISVAYDQKAELMYVGTWPSAVGAPKGYTVMLNGTVQDVWFPQGKRKSIPHDVSVSPGGVVYVGDVISNRVFRFKPSKQNRRR